MSGIDDTDSPHPLSDYTAGRRCAICGNLAPAKPGDRFACGLPTIKLHRSRADVRCPFDSFALPPRLLSPSDVTRASLLISNYDALGRDLDSMKSDHFQVMFGGHYHTTPEIQEAARLGLVKLWCEKRATLVQELRALGVGMTE